MTRKQIYEIIEKDDGSNIWSHIYDVFMFCTIILSVVPLMFWDDPKNIKYFTELLCGMILFYYLCAQSET